MNDIGEMLPVEYRIKGQLGFEVWDEAGARLRSMQEAIDWWVGDWLLYGEEEFGEEYMQAKALEGMSPSAIRQHLWVAKQIPPEERHEVSWTHHRAVASLPAYERDAMLLEAQREGLSSRELEARVRGKKGEEEPGEEPPPDISQHKPIRLPKLLAAAKGRNCIRCRRDDGTVVRAHYSGMGALRLGHGTGVKVHDYASACLCSRCHAEFDGYERDNSYERAWEFLLLCLLELERDIREEVLI